MFHVIDLKDVHILLAFLFFSQPFRQVRSESQPGQKVIRVPRGLQGPNLNM